MSDRFELPGYELEELIGAGGTGTVWRARDTRGDQVAVKRLHSPGTAVRERLRRDAAVLSSVAGDHVVRMRDVVVTETDAIVVTDYAAGGSLATVLAARGGLAAPEVVTLVGPLATTLADGHDRRLVHGAVTPANIVFTADGRPMLADYGLARLVGARPADSDGPAADVYALCSIADKALRRDIAPPALVAAIEAGLAPDPDHRPSARQLAGDVLRSCAAAPVGLVRAEPPPAAPQQPTVVVPPPAARTPRVAAPRPPHRRVLMAVMSVGALLLAIAGGVMWGHRNQSSAAVLSLPPSAPASAAAVKPRPTWLAVIRAIDSRRSTAFATADAGLLRSVYAPGSAALAADLTTLRAITRSHATVRGFVITAVSARLLRRAGERVVLRVTDVLSAYTLVAADGSSLRRVAARSARTLTLTITRIDGEWRIAAVSR